MPTYDEIIHVPKLRGNESLNAALRTALGAKIAGMSTGPVSGDPTQTRITVHFLVPNNGDVAPSPDRTIAQDIVNKHGSLEVIADQTNILADGLDTAVITCNDPAITPDANLWLSVWLDDGEYMAPTMVPLATVQSGINLKTDFPGSYLIEIRRINDYESGYIKVEAL